MYSRQRALFIIIIIIISDFTAHSARELKIMVTKKKDTQITDNEDSAEGQPHTKWNCLELMLIINC